MKWAIKLLCAAWTICLFLGIGALELQPDATFIESSDYLITFHVAGNLLRTGQVEKLYPPVNTANFIQAPFNAAAHTLLPDMPTNSVAEYMYMPLSAFCFLSLSYLPFVWSMIVWQGLSVLAMAVIADFLCPNANEKGSRRVSIEQILILTFGLLPVCLTLISGQVGIVFGILPLASGYRCRLKNKSFVAGLCWSLASLKPQFLIASLILCSADMFKKSFRSSLGFVVGLSGLLVSNLVFFGPDNVGAWLRTLSLSDRLFSDTAFNGSAHLTTSLSRAVLLMVPSSEQGLYRPIIYTIAIAIFVSAMTLIWHLSRRSIEPNLIVKASLIIACYVIPVVVPHFFLYDFSIFVPVNLIIFSTKWPAKTGQYLRRIGAAQWLSINAYCVAMILTHGSCPAITLALATFALFILTWVTLSKMTQAV